VTCRLALTPRGSGPHAGAVAGEVVPVRQRHRAVRIAARGLERIGAADRISALQVRGGDRPAGHPMQAWPRVLPLRAATVERECNAMRSLGGRDGLHRLRRACPGTKMDAVRVIVADVARAHAKAARSPKIDT